MRGLPSVMHHTQCGTIIFRMETKPSASLVSPPRLITSFVTGFNAVANHIYLVLFPILLDLFLWFGPRLRVKTLLEPAITELNRQINTTGTVDPNTIRNTQEIAQIILDRFNMFSLLRTFPIGIPSLMAGQAPLQTPLGHAPIYEMTSLLGVIGLWILFNLIGILLACLYFGEMVRLSREKYPNPSTTRIWWQAIQIVLLTIALFTGLMVFFIPISMMITVIALINPSLAQIALFFVSLFLIWVLVPLVYSPHGIFTYSQNVLTSAITSLKLVRFFLPGTGLFLLIAILINQGLNIIWTMPSEDSWMLLVGVLGHAFISTGLLMASFFYYLGGMRWMQENFDNKSKRSTLTI